jgi:hypothetical protein
MVDFAFNSDADILFAYADVLEQYPRTFDTFVGKTIVNDVQQRVDVVNQYPGPVETPIEWTSPAQQGYYFGVVAEYDAQGNIIPYERKGTLFDGTEVVWDVGTFELRVTIPNPIAKYVVGIFQQGFHANTGWVNIIDEYLRILIETQDNLIEGYIDITDIKGLI